MTEENKGSGTSTTVKALQATSTTLELADHGSLGLGAVERAVPGVTRAAANVIKEVPVIGGAGSGTLKVLGNFGGKVAVPLQLVIGTGEVIYDIHKGDYRAVGEDAGGTIGGIAGGIAVGAAIGSVVPVVGTAIGGIVGGIVGWWAGKKAGGAIAGHFVDKANAQRTDAEKLEAAKVSAASAFHIAGAPAPTPTPTPTPTPAPVVAKTPTPKATPTPTPTPAETDPVTTPAPETDPDPTPTPTPTATPAGDSLGTLLDRASSLHGSDLGSVFDRVTKFASDSHLSLGTKFSLASMAVGFFKMINIGGWADGMVDWAEHFALDAMKDDLINQGPNLAGSSDTRSHLPNTQNAPQLVPTPEPAP